VFKGLTSLVTLGNACGIRWSSRVKEGNIYLYILFCAKIDVQTLGKTEPQHSIVPQEETPQEGDEFYQLDCRTGEAVPFVSRSLSNTSWQESPFLVREEDCTSIEAAENQVVPSNNHLASDEPENLSSEDLMEDQLWEEGYDGKFARDVSANEDMSRSAEDEDDEDEGTNTYPPLSSPFKFIEDTYSYFSIFRSTRQYFKDGGRQRELLL